jgi:hypothetical protein
MPPSGEFVPRFPFPPTWRADENAASQLPDRSDRSSAQVLAELRWPCQRKPDTQRNQDRSHYQVE